MAENKYVVLKYLRLSLEDGDDGESNSISNQRDLLDLHISATFKGKKIEVMELVDDGYSGTNMNRPGMKRLLVLAEMNLVQCVIVKDLSRFARNYLEVGRYTDKIFPEWRVRFIAVNDNYDSLDYQGVTCGVDVAIKNLTNAMYSQDLSQKITSVKRLQQKRGECYAPYAIYGYMKSPEDKHKLIIDPEPAEVVRRIFNMKDSGMKYSQIAKQLNEEGILSPSEYKVLLTKKEVWRRAERRLPMWNKSTVCRILDDERYIGNMVSGQTRVEYVGGKAIRANREDYVIVENTHEAIVDRELFYRVRPRRISRDRKNAKRLLDGLLRCPGCGHAFEKYGTYPNTIKFRCSSRASGANNENCCQETFKEEELNAIVIQAVKMEIARSAELIEVRRCMKEKEKKNEKKINAIIKKIKGLKQQKIDGYIKLTKNELTEEEFLKLKKKIESSIEECREELESYKVSELSSADERTINLFEEFVEAENFTNEMFKRLIKTIYVYDDRRIEIKWNFKEKVV